MQRIIINEIDETTNVLTPAPSDIIFVPGLSIGGNASPFEPVLCTSLDEFVYQFGGVAPTFKEDQFYPSGANGFAKDAIYNDGGGSGAIMFKKGDCDPSYVYAKELIRRGMNVIYERINVVPGDGEKPEDYINVTSIYSGLDVVFSNSLSQNMINPLFIKSYRGEFDAEKKDYKEGDIVFMPEKTYVLKGTIGLKDSDTINDLKSLDPSVSDTYFCNANLTKAKSDSPLENWIYEQPCEASVGSYVKFGFETVESEVAIWQSFEKSELPSGTGYFKFESSEDGGSWVELTNEEIYDEVEFTPLTDKNEFDIKYLTSGGYPVFEYCGNSLVNKMMVIGEVRGDCMVFIDHTDNPTRSLLATNKHSVYYSIANGAYKVSDERGIAQMYTPYCKFVNMWATSGDNADISLPASFGYMLCLSSALKFSPSWLAIAGVNRGVLPISSFKCENTTRKLTVPIAESYTDESGGTSINAITNVTPYGYTIWGNRTLRSTIEGTKATSFTNIRNLVCDVKKVAYKAAKSCLFEQNTDILWSNFKSQVSALLDKMVTGAGITGYNFVRNMDVDRTRIEATIIIYPVYAVESFDITVVLSDDDEITVME